MFQTLETTRLLLRPAVTGTFPSAGLSAQQLEATAAISTAVPVAVRAVLSDEGAAWEKGALAELRGSSRGVRLRNCELNVGKPRCALGGAWFCRAAATFHSLLFHLRLQEQERSERERGRKGD